MSDSLDIEWLKAQLQLPLPGPTAQDLMSSRQRLSDEIPGTARPGAVLALFFHKAEGLHLLLIKRVSDGRTHSGQISFPGGKKDPEDESLLFTAVRETQEEVGVLVSPEEIVGGLTPLYIPVSNYHVHPFVAYTTRELTYSISEQEVDVVVEVPLKVLLAGESKVAVDIYIPSLGSTLENVKAYRLPDGNVIWGATAMILSELESVILKYGA